MNVNGEKGLCDFAPIHNIRINPFQSPYRIEAGLIPGDPEWAPIDLPWYVHLYAMLPLRSLSRLWGHVNSITLPVPLREPVYLAYSRMFGCNIEEALVEDLSSYPNLASFFYRELKAGARSIDVASPLVKPDRGRFVFFLLSRQLC